MKNMIADLKAEWFFIKRFRFSKNKAVVFHLVLAAAAILVTGFQTLI